MSGRARRTAVPPWRVLVVFGTRPEAIKLSPVIMALRNQTPRIATRVVVTAQHREMLDQVLDLYGIKPDHDLDIMRPRQTLTQITVRALQRMGKLIEAERPDMVLVQGDTTTTFVAALSAFYCRVPVGHVEAGLRTYDKYHPYPCSRWRRWRSAAVLGAASGMAQDSPALR